MLIVSRSKPSKRFFKIGVLKMFAIFTAKHQCQRLFLIKRFINKRLQNRCFPLNIARFFRKIFSQNTSIRLLLIFRSFWRFPLNFHREHNKIDLFCKQIICKKIHFSTRANISSLWTQEVNAFDLRLVFRRNFQRQVRMH